MKVKSFVCSGLLMLLSGFTTTASVASVHGFESGWDGFINTGSKVFFVVKGQRLLLELGLLQGQMAVLIMCF